jgi:outer membrane receptor protein involved in Fe transport
VTHPASRIDRGKGLLLAALCAAPLACALAAPEPAAGIEYRIDAGALSDALTTFARQSGLQILFDAQLVSGRSSRGIDARSTARDALDTLLAGSGLVAEPVNANTYVLKNPPAQPPKKKTRATAAAPRASQDSPPATPLLPVQVTGSHIRRAEWESASPISVITHEEIERSGLRTLVDVLRTQPGIEVAARPEVMAAAPAANYAYGGAAGASTVGMRGLGARATLVLVDGRRIAPYGLTLGGAGQVVDLNAIPVSLVERIEILRDGASAIYGADAIGGVINVILRRTFDGAEVAVDYGIAGKGDAQRRGASATLGGSDGTTRLFLHADWSERDPLVGSQRDWYTLDRRSRGLNDNRSLYSFPGNYIYADDKGQRWIAAVPGCAKQFVDENGLCRLDEAKYTTLQTAQSVRSLFLRASRDVGAATELHADLRVSGVDQRQEAAPFAVTYYIPRGFPGSPDPSRPVIVLYSFADVGPIRESTESLTHALNVGAKGTAAGWQWNADFSIQGNAVTDRMEGFLRPSEALRLLGQGQYFFGGPNSSEALSALSQPLLRKGRSSLSEIIASASGPAFEMPAGTAMLGVGAEARHARVKDVPDPLLQSDDRLFGERSYVQRASSNSAAAYAELELPLTRGIVGEVAWRFDRSQSVGSAVSPKLGLRWRVADSLLLRATAAEGYRPPTLLDLNRPIVLDNERDVIVPATLGPCANALDPQTLIELGSIECRLKIFTARNPQGLKAETSRSHTLGFVYAPSENFSLGVDLYDIRREQEIGVLPLEYALTHTDEFPGFLLRDENGKLTGLKQYPVNLGRTRTRGVDVAAQYRFYQSGQSGWVARFDATYADRREAQTRDDAPSIRLLGYDSNPRTRARLGLDYTRLSWTATANVTYIGPYRNTSFAGDELTCDGLEPADGRCRTPGFATLDLGLRYARPKWSAGFNVLNALDRHPVYNGTSAANYNILFDDPVGRYYTLSLSYRF